MRQAWGCPENHWGRRGEVGVELEGRRAESEVKGGERSQRVGSWGPEDWLSRL